MFVSRIVKAGSDLVVCVVNLLDCYKSNVCKIIHWTEDALVNSGLFALQSKDCLADGKVHCVLIDASEVEVERPKKNKNSTTQARRKGTP